MLLIVTDAHLLPDTPASEDFWEMLSAVSSGEHDILFLGDVMELWMAISRYEDELHARFVEWARKENRNRKIYFIEGNHEYFVASKYKDAFTDASEDSLRLGRAFFTHGQYIQEAPWGINRLTQRFFKSWFTRLVLRVIPGGETIIRKVKGALGSNGKYPHPVVPEARIEAWSGRILEGDASVGHLFLGHFHAARTLSLPGGRTCHVLPPWKQAGEVTLFDLDANRIATAGPWRQVLDKSVIKNP